MVLLGLVRVSVCNQTVEKSFWPRTQGFLDGRWEDYQTHHYSLPDKWAPDVSFFPYTLCEGFKEPHPTVEVTFLKRIDAERGNQKFKLMNIKVCQVNA